MHIEETHSSECHHEHCHEQTHSHACDHTHSHSHDHSSSDVATSSEEALALLTYMLDHNRHHAMELHDIAHHFPSVESDLIHDAVDKLAQSNALIEQALSLINNR